MKKTIIQFVCLFIALTYSYYCSSQDLTRQVITSEKGDTVHVFEGTLTLPESREETNANLIQITFQILKSTSKTPGPAIFMLAGGPGGSWLNTAHLEERFEEITFYRQLSDVVIFDQRGTGRSVPNLDCGEIFKDRKVKELSEESISKALIELSQSCRDHWISESVNLDAYNTHESALDIEDLRQHLGYSKIILVGGSYGSHLGLHYIKVFENYVDCAIFHGIEGPNHTLDRPDEVLNTMSRIAKTVEESEYFEKKLKGQKLIDIFSEIMNKIETNQLPELNKLVAQFIFTFKVGSRKDLTTWPNNILALQSGDYSFAEAVQKHLQKEDPPHAMSNAMDFASWATTDRLNVIRTHPTNRLLGHLNLSYFAKENVWSTDILDDNFRADVEAQIPILLIHGSWDMSTPIENAIAVSKKLSNHHLLVVKHGSHGAYYELFEEWENMSHSLRKFIINHNLDIQDTVILEIEFPELFDDVQVEFWEAVTSNNIMGAEKAINNGAQVNLIDTRSNRNGRTAMNWAAWHDHVEMLQFLLRNGGELNITNKSGYTPLHHAIENCSINAIEFLIGQGADVQMPAHNGRSPIETAKSDCKKALKLLDN